MKERPILFSGEMVRAILAGNKTQTRRIIKPQPDEDGFDREIYNHEPRVLGPWVDTDGRIYKCPFGVPGDRLWVRETWRVGAWDVDNSAIAVDYKADGYCRREWLQLPDDVAGEDLFVRLHEQSAEDAEKAGMSTDEEGAYHWEPGQSPCRWRSSIFMPRFASRITLDIVNVRIERLQEISEADAVAEGITGPHHVGYPAYRVPGDSKPRYSTPVSAFENLWDSINGKRGYGWNKNPWVWVIEGKKV